MDLIGLNSHATELIFLTQVPANKKESFRTYEGGSICNENPFITPSTNALGFYGIRQTKDQSVAVIMVHETLFYLSEFNKLHTF